MGVRLWVSISCIHPSYVFVCVCVRMVEYCNIFRCVCRVVGDRYG